ncbi:MAG: MerR family transcriptional regulator [Planctomycetota bacterium]
MVPRKLYKIGEIVQHTGVSRQTIHNYTVWGLIREETRTPGNHRLYDEEVFKTLETIKKLKQSMTIRQIRQHLEQQRRTTPASTETTDH